MARKSKTLTDTNNELGLSDLRIRLNFLEKENSKLIKQIETNRTKLNTLNDSIKEVGIQIAQRVAPFRQKILELDEQIHAVFQEILTGRKLGKKSRKDIESVYYHLQLDGVISPKHLPMEEELFENDDDDFENEFDWAHYRGHSNQQIVEDIPKPDRDELKKIRQLFLRLADSFHPDKVTDEAEKEYRTEIMKEINLAYQDGDLARLLAIEKEQELGAIIDRDSTDDLSRHCAKVEAENRYLKDQLENLKQQLKITKKTQQGEMTATFKKITKYGGDPIGEALREIEDQIAIIEQMHQFVVDFRDRRMTIKEFLKGPTALRLQQMSEEELMLEFLAQFQ
ncbi:MULTISPECIES: J domain-containing protein [Pseudanabaena]|uniref:Heat shock protein DnaJ domain protein n=2 Tax=Pseudanabaena TaxID=1152 RepID=L8MZK4_9CYAN|nr:MULTISPECIES: J domain-containing protein [Pseudanabaena]ELS31423.1 heat shock protein DnaJ domain protein [Pseudanabaena biceps PCC 7429]MDG3496320.1 J domain-containing protein [Pseudanabaena catenata USMAC16]